MNHAIDRVLAGASVRPTGTTAFLIWVLGLAFLRFGVTPPDWLATAIILIPIGVISLLAPRWAEDRGILFKHPAAIAAYATALVAWMLPPIVKWIFGADIGQLTGDEVMALSGFISWLVSLITPLDDPAGDPSAEIAGFPKEHVGEVFERKFASLKEPTGKLDNVEWPDGSKGFKHLTLKGTDENVYTVPVVPAQASSPGE